LLWEALKSARVELALSNVPSYTFTYSALRVLLTKGKIYYQYLL